MPAPSALLSHRLFLPVALSAYCLGLITAGSLPFLREYPFWPHLLTAFLLAVFLLRKTIAARAIPQLCLLLSLFFLAGLARLPQVAEPPPTDHAYYLFEEPQIVTVSGQLESNPSRRPQRVTFLARIEEIIDAGKTKRVSGLVKFSLPAGNVPIAPGDHFVARAKISRISSFVNPGLFNYRAYMAEKNILLQGWIASPLHLTRLEAPPPFSPLRRLHYGVQGIRTAIGRFADRTVGGTDAALFKALLIGDRGEVPEEVAEHFKASGTMHILAISGLHIGILALFCMTSFRWLLGLFPSLLQSRSAWKISILLSILPLTLYAFLAGWQPPVVRALIMFTVLATAIALNRQSDICNTVVLAALLILAFNPASLFSLSFQLSFSAVFAIILFAKRFPAIFSLHHPSTPPLSRLGGLVVASILVSLAATLGTAPLLLYHFHRLSFLSPVATLVISPLICFFALPLALLGCIGMALSPHFAAFCFKTGAAGLQLARFCNLFFAGLPFAEIHFFRPSPFEILLYYGLLISLLSIKKKRFAGTAALIFVGLLALSSGFTYWRTTQNRESEIVFLDVGQGSATVAHLPGGKTYLFDAGGSAWNNFDAGENIVAPYLWNRRILHLDDIVLSHSHADHYNGLFYLIEHFSPQRLWVSSIDSAEENYRHLLELARQQGTSIMVAGKFERLGVDREREIILANGPKILRGEGEASFDTVNTGLVTRIRLGQFSLLLPGDIGAREENLLLAALGPFLKADMLLAAHHGSPGSNSEALLRGVHPRQVVVSTGWAGEPIAEMLQARAPFLQKKDIHITSLDGAMWVSIGESGILCNTAGKGGD